MFDFDVGKLLLIGVVALIFIPPKDLPNALRQLGRLIGQARRMASDFQSQFSEAMREAELTEIKDELGNLKRQASVEDAFSHVADMLETKVDMPADKPAATGEPATGEAAPAAPESAPIIATPLAVAPTPPEPEPVPVHEPSKPGPGSAP